MVAVLRLSYDRLEGPGVQPRPSSPSTLEVPDVADRTCLRWPENLLSRMAPQPNGCIWLDGLSVSRLGYFSVQRDGKHVLAHRAAYEMFVGPIPSGKELDHTCHSEDLSCLGGPSCLHRRCVNWEHLEPVTHAENMRRGRTGVVNATRQLAKTTCPQGHPYAGENLYVDPRGHRGCRTCRREANRRQESRRRA